MECLREHKRQGRGWTMLVDVDEYMTFNPAVRDFDPADSSRNQDWAVPPIEEPGSLSILLNSIIIPNPDFDEIETPCLPVFRRQFSATESPDSEVNAMTPLGFEGSTFQTMRWRRYGYDVEDYKTRLGTACEIRRHIPNKVIVDLDRMRLQDLYHPENSGNPHAPLEICPINVYLKLNKTPLIAHHYMGTLDQWLYRVNDKRGTALILCMNEARQKRTRWPDNFVFMFRRSRVSSCQIQRPEFSNRYRSDGSCTALAARICCSSGRSRGAATFERCRGARATPWNELYSLRTRSEQSIDRRISQIQGWRRCAS